MLLPRGWSPLLPHDIKQNWFNAALWSCPESARTSIFGGTIVNICNEPLGVWLEFYIDINLPPIFRSYKSAKSKYYLSLCWVFDKYWSEFLVLDFCHNIDHNFDYPRSLVILKSMQITWYMTVEWQMWPNLQVRLQIELTMEVTMN